MLVLSRKIGEEIVIGEAAIRVCIVAVEGSKVRVGIDAPEAVRVDRREIWERRRLFAGVPAPAG